ncbi:hypothetical protein LTR86_008175 [Recurvomyces mirabilis]|nr:hypothetical protein LTR86_008175 [Recurvomyces mirabilis]
MSATAPIPLVPLMPGATRLSGIETAATLPPALPTSSGLPPAQTQTQQPSTSASGQIATGPTSSATTPVAQSANSGVSKHYWSNLAHVNVSVATWLGAGLATAALLVAIYCGAPMYRLAIWTAKKDFREACVNDRSIGLTSAACNMTLLDPLRPPPISKRSFEPSTLIPGTTSPIVATSTILAGAVMLVSVFTIFRRYLGDRPIPVVSYVRANLACIVALPDPSVDNVLASGCTLAYIPLRHGQGMALKKRSRMPDGNDGFCIFCSNGPTDLDYAHVEPQIITICGHPVHDQCVATYVRSKGIMCPSCGGALGIVCEYRQPSRRYSNGNTGRVSLGWTGGKSRPSSVSTDRSSQQLAFHIENDFLPVGQHVQPSPRVQDQNLLFVLQMARHAVSLESSHQYEGAIEAYSTTCQLLDTRASKLDPSNEAGTLGLTDARSVYHNRAEKIRHWLESSSRRLTTASTEVEGPEAGVRQDTRLSDTDFGQARIMQEIDALADVLGRRSIHDVVSEPPAPSIDHVLESPDDTKAATVARRRTLPRSVEMSVQSTAPSEWIEGIKDLDKNEAHTERVSAVAEWLESVDLQHTATMIRELPDGARLKAERPTRRALSTWIDTSLAAPSNATSLEVQYQDRVSDSRSVVEPWPMQLGSSSLQRESAIIQDNSQQLIRTHGDTGTYSPPRVKGLRPSDLPAGISPTDLLSYNTEEGQADLLRKHLELTTVDNILQPLPYTDLDAPNKIRRPSRDSLPYDRLARRRAILSEINEPPAKGWLARLPRLFKIKGHRTG